MYQGAIAIGPEILTTANPMPSLRAAFIRGNNATSRFQGYAPTVCGIPTKEDLIKMILDHINGC